jgi:hypothetical protein
MSQKQQSSQGKNYLFYSAQCQHSKRLLQRLQKTALLNIIQLVNIDDPRVTLPPFIQCVPTLYIPTTRHVLTEDHLFEWVENQLKVETSNAGNVNMEDITGDANILPFHSNEMTQGASGAAYSFLDDTKNDMLNQNYSFLQERDINKMPEFTRYDAPPPAGTAPSMAGPVQKKTGGTVDKEYEQLMKSRGNDNRRSGPPTTPNFSSSF